MTFIVQQGAAALAAATFVLTAGAALAQEKAPDAPNPVQLSLIEDVQLVGSESSIAGVRLAGSSRNRDVTGFDQALLAARTEGNERGFQLALVGEVDGDLVGAQLAGISADVDGAATGVQLGGLINRVGSIVGAQLGVILNHGVTVRGVQIGLVNHAEQLEGVQLGLINVHRDGVVPFFPGVNVGF